MTAIWSPSWESVPGNASFSPERLQIAALEAPLPTKVRLVKAMFFPVVMCGCESWTIKKAERGRIDAFELWCWRRLFKSPLDSKEIQPVHPKGNQSWIFIEGLMLKLKLQYFWPPDVKNWLIVSGECVISSVPSRRKQIWQGGPVFQLSYNSFLFEEQSIIHPRGMRAGLPQKAYSMLFGFLFL